MAMDGGPALIISPKCKYVRKGLAGAFCYRRVQVAGDERYTDEPEKNAWSHPVEALEYGLLGAGEGHEALSPPNMDKEGIDHNAARDWYC